MYDLIENGLNVIYPEKENATYISLVNYSDDLKKPFQRWYRYKEGFSIDLVKRLINDFSAHEKNVIVDPFSGSSSTLVAANGLNCQSIGFEVNPFSYFLSKVKLDKYTREDIDLFKETFNIVITQENEEYPLPDLSFSEKVFQEDVRKKLMIVKRNIYNIKETINNEKVFNLLKLGWLACIEELSEYRKAGNGLKKRKLKNPVILTQEDVYFKLDHHYSMMYKDLIESIETPKEARIINDTSLNMMEYLESNSVTGIIFSPPYANCFDYTEIYKLELWFGDFVQSYGDLKKLRNISLRSHLNSFLKEDIENLYTIPELEMITDVLETRDLWDKKIPRMIKMYFHDMFRIIENCYKSLAKDGFCHIVVSNSAYGGVVVPTDILFAKYAESIGFEVERIEVARYIITSSQQYEITKENKNLLRESIICLRK